MTGRRIWCSMRAWAGFLDSYKNEHAIVMLRNGVFFLDKAMDLCIINI